jgi:hypothetical protein
MYMEAYGGATSIAESIIKRAVGALTAKDEINKAKTNTEAQAEQPTISEDGISPKSSGGVGSKADPNIVKSMNDFEAASKIKAMESLNQKIESLEGLRIYQQGLIEQKESENKVLQDKLGRLQLRK